MPDENWLDSFIVEKGCMTCMRLRSMIYDYKLAATKAYRSFIEYTELLKRTEISDLECR